MVEVQRASYTYVQDCLDTFLERAAANTESGIRVATEALGLCNILSPCEKRSFWTVLDKKGPWALNVPLLASMFVWRGKTHETS